MLRYTFVLWLAILTGCQVAAPPSLTTKPPTEADAVERKTSYVGGSIDINAPLLCKCNELAAGGFWQATPETLAKGAKISKEATTTWRITITGDTASVVRFSGVTETIEKTEIFSVEPTVGGILLVSQRRGRGESPQIMTIDPSSSSFVYSSQQVTPVYNRANVFFGTCRSD